MGVQNVLVSNNFQTNFYVIQTVKFRFKTQQFSIFVLTTESSFFCVRTNIADIDFSTVSY